MSGWGLITAEEVSAEQARTQASAETTDAAVAAAGQAVPDALASEWGLFMKQLTTWDSTPIVNFWTPWAPDGAIVVTGDTGDTMMAWESQLQAWQAKLAPLLAAKAPPGESPFIDPSGSLAGNGPSVTTTITLVALVVGGIYALHSALLFAPRK